jgi:hypothetical protein
MSTSAHEEKARADRVDVDDRELKVHLADGRTLAVPNAWFPRLAQATPEERSHWELLGEGEGIRWPLIDEDLSVAGLLRGTLAPGA